MNKKIKKIIDKKNKSKIVCLTAYSKNIAQILGKLSPFVIEVGLDYVIDKEFNPVFIEANAQPKGKLKGLMKKKKIPSIMFEHRSILKHPFEIKNLNSIMKLNFDNNSILSRT